jgi:hypothetical protein
VQVRGVQAEGMISNYVFEGPMRPLYSDLPSQEPPGKPRASKVTFKDGKNRICVGFPDEVRAKLGKK